MEKLKDIVLIGFAVVGFISILSGFTEQQVYGTPESHQWEMTTAFEQTGQQRVYILNKVTGEVRKYSKAAMNDKKLTEEQYYYVMTEHLR
mgnify:CR=1 FL=1